MGWELSISEARWSCVTCGATIPPNTEFYSSAKIGKCETCFRKTPEYKLIEANWAERKVKADWECSKCCGNFHRLSEPWFKNKSKEPVCRDCALALTEGRPVAPKASGPDAAAAKALAENPELVRQLKELVTKTAKDAAKSGMADLVEDAVKRLVPVQIEVKIGDKPKVKLTGHQYPAFNDVLTLAANRKNTLMIGPAGCGKSHLAHQLSDALKLRFGFVPCTAGMSEGQLTGRLLPTGKSGTFEYQTTDFVECYEKGGVFLLDEVDAADPNVLLVINAALANGYLALPHRPGKPVAKRHPDFICIAAANTFGTGANRMYVGRNQLDESTLDRFRIGQLLMDYDRDLERTLMKDEALLNRLWAIRDLAARAQLRRVVSTRFIEDAAQLQSAGWSNEKIIGQLVSGWTTDEKSRVGVN
jgi:cobaltochelatase CobS